MAMASDSHRLPEIVPSNLPSWPRAGIKSSLQPLPIPRDRLQAVQSVPQSSNSSTSSSRTVSRDSTQPERRTSVKLPQIPNTDQKISRLEKNLTYLQKQHKETLQKLHEEMDRLKIKNKELSFQLVMGNGSSNVSSGSNSSAVTVAQRRAPLGRSSVASIGTGALGRSPKCSMDESFRTEDGNLPDELKAIVLEEEIKDLRNALKNEKSRNARLQKVIEQRRPRSIDQSDGESCASGYSPLDAQERVLGSYRHHQRSSYISQVPPGQPTMEQYESIIKHLQRTNDMMAHELVQLKSDLRDVLYTEKLTPETFLIAKAYIKRDGDEDVISENGLPKFAHVMNNHPQNMLDTAYQAMKESVTLPALKPKLLSTQVQRKKKTAALQKARLTQTFPKL